MAGGASTRDHRTSVADEASEAELENRLAQLTNVDVDLVKSSFQASLTSIQNIVAAIKSKAKTAKKGHKIDTTERIEDFWVRIVYSGVETCFQKSPAELVAEYGNTVDVQIVEESRRCHIFDRLHNQWGSDCLRTLHLSLSLPQRPSYQFCEHLIKIAELIHFKPFLKAIPRILNGTPVTAITPTILQQYYLQVANEFITTSSKQSCRQAPPNRGRLLQRKRRKTGIPPSEHSRRTDAQLELNVEEDTAEGVGLNDDDLIESEHSLHDELCTVDDDASTLVFDETSVQLPVDSSEEEYFESLGQLRRTGNSVPSPLTKTMARNTASKSNKAPNQPPQDDVLQDSEMADQSQQHPEGAQKVLNEGFGGKKSNPAIQWLVDTCTRLSAMHTEVAALNDAKQNAAVKVKTIKGQIAATIGPAHDPAKHISEAIVNAQKQIEAGSTLRDEFLEFHRLQERLRVRSEAAGYASAFDLRASLNEDKSKEIEAGLRETLRTYKALAEDLDTALADKLEAVNSWDDAKNAFEELEDELKGVQELFGQAGTSVPYISIASLQTRSREDESDSAE